jgi:heme ABC exporter ATP-binding subunit CcmA
VPDLVVDVRDAVVTMAGFPALAGATLAVREGEIVVLAGPNGAGKTTLLRLCAGLVAPVRGSARVFGLDVAEQRDAVRSRVGFLGHANGLYGELTTRENVAFHAALVGASRDEVDAALNRLGLGGRLAGVPVTRLSAGQRRRCALANLVVRRAGLWLLDEPHAGLDAAARRELDDTLLAASRSGATIMFASHDLDRLGNLAPRIVRIESGCVTSDTAGLDAHAAAGGAVTADDDAESVSSTPSRKGARP